MILGINNRTENWKTAREFAPFFKDADARQRLVRRLGDIEGTDPGEITLELYWKGMRDYLHDIKTWEGDTLNDKTIQDFSAKYQRIFPQLRDQIEKYRPDEKNKGAATFGSLNKRNYCLNEITQRELEENLYKKLANNLYNTEIDIVLETPTRLYIGEAKSESGFGSDGKLVLTHQLIRQYVMARILLSCLGEKKDIVPFVVGKERSGMKKTAQVGFMIQKDWLCSRNVLEWSDIEGLLTMDDHVSEPK